MPTTYTLMAGQTVPNNAPDGIGVPTPVSVLGTPTRARFTFSLSGPATAYAEATVSATVPGYTNVIEQVIYPTLLVMAIEKGSPNTISQEIRLGAPYSSYAAALNLIAPGNQAGATLTMTV
jgi:hypothetical protein